MGHWEGMYSIDYTSRWQVSTIRLSEVLRLVMVVVHTLLSTYDIGVLLMQRWTGCL